MKAVAQILLRNAYKHPILLLPANNLRAGSYVDTLY
jgi:hypothetical protein